MEKETRIVSVTGESGRGGVNQQGFEPVSFKLVNLIKTVSLVKLISTSALRVSLEKLIDTRSEW